MRNEDIREKAFLDYQKSMKYKEIAEKYNVNLSTVKSWAVRYWKKDDCNKREKKLQLKDKKVATRGGQLGNKNAINNSGGSAPKRNRNAEKHGAYSTVYLDALDEEEIKLIQQINYEEEYQLEQQINIYTIRERRLLLKIKEYKESTSKTKDLLIKSITKENSIQRGEKTEFVETELEPVMNTILLLESELTKIQKAKTKTIDSLIKLRNENRELAIKEQEEKNKLLENQNKKIQKELDSGKEEEIKITFEMASNTRKENEK